VNEWMKRFDGLVGPHAGLIKNLMAPLFIVMVLAMMVLPLPAFALDALFTFNIAMALIVMMVSANMVRPLDFAASRPCCW
jgi:flagellar biosynthesis protein FlhA